MNAYVEIIGRDRLFAALDGLVAVALNSQPWDKHDELHRTLQATHLDTKGSGTWPPNKPATEIRKARDPRTSFFEQMQQTGQLYFSLTRKFAPFNVTVENPDEYASGSSDPKARAHQEGKGRLPVRLVKVVTEEEVDQHLELFIDRKQQEIEALGFEVQVGIRR